MVGGVFNHKTHLILAAASPWLGEAQGGTGRHGGLGEAQGGSGRHGGLGEARGDPGDRRTSGDLPNTHRERDKELKTQSDQSKLEHGNCRGYITVSWLF